jgi:tRNA G18 (ribose-2'-O)-methylase SpoU
LFVAEGHLAAARLAGSRYPVVSLLLATEKVAAHAALIAAVRARGAPVYHASRRVIASTVGFDLHRGVVALGGRLAPLTVADLAAVSGPLLAVEGVNDHENLGALFRNAAAFAAGGVVLDPTCADPLYRRSVRVSLGHVLGVPFARSTDWPADLGRLGRPVLALTPAAARTVAPVRGAVALLVGAEGPGLSAGALAAADDAVGIPMAPGVDSLNVATAAAIALFITLQP